MAESLIYSGITLDEAKHIYTDGKGKQYQGITSSLIPAIFGETYPNVPESVLQQAAERGTLIHKETEFIDGCVGYESDIREAREYKRLIDEAGLRPIESEYIVTDKKHFASPIDKVFEGDIIADIKTTSEVHLPQVMFQLSWYAAYYKALNGRDVRKAYVIWLPKEQYGKCRLIEVKLATPGAVRKAVKAFLAGKDCTEFAEKFTPKLPASYNSRIVKASKQISLLLKKEKEIAALKKSLSAFLIDTMAEHGAKVYENDAIRITYVEPTERQTVDGTKLKEEYPDVYANCIKTSLVKASVRFTTK